MDKSKKIKVAMICHFSTEEVRKHLPLNHSRALFNFVRKMFRLSPKRGTYSDIAPWDRYIIESCNKRGDIELVVISAHSGLKKRHVSFVENGVEYHFVRCDFANMLKTIAPTAKFWAKRNPLNFLVRRIVKKVNPNLVLLVGTENSYYSSTVLRIKDYPIYVLCQTVYNNEEFKQSGGFSEKNAYVERKILEKEQYLGVYCQKHYDLLRQIGYEKYIFKFEWPRTLNTFKPLPCETKEYDFINFALSMSNSKGFPDSIKALAIVKQSYPNVKLNLVDGGPVTAREDLKKLIHELDLEDNVSFTPFFANQYDLFNHLQKSRFGVLPCKVDNISGTQLQCMRFGLPIVVYKTTGTPSLNEKRRCVLIAELNDVEGLAANMIQLMSDATLSSSLKENSLKYIEELDRESASNMDNLIKNFSTIISNYNHGTPIPEEQLFENQIK